ncbi:LOW QUALITY PROTEIN: hypothetical protein ACG7TL_008881 [Trametes sanguinea]
MLWPSDGLWQEGSLSGLALEAGIEGQNDPGGERIKGDCFFPEHGSGVGSERACSVDPDERSCFSTYSEG